MAESRRRPGRPTIGGRVTLALGPLIERVDQARGKRTRAAWIRDAIERALPPPVSAQSTAACGCVVGGIHVRDCESRGRVLAERADRRTT